MSGKGRDGAARGPAGDPSPAQESPPSGGGATSKAKAPSGAGKAKAPGAGREGKTPSKAAAKARKPKGGKGKKEAERTVAAAAGRRSATLAREMLCVEIRRVRSLFGEIADRYRAGTEGALESLIAELEGRRLPPSLVEEMLGEVRSLSVKENKGRRKDLARVERLASSLSAMLPS